MVAAAKSALRRRAVPTLRFGGRIGVQSANASREGKSSVQAVKLKNWGSSNIDGGICFRAW